MKSPTDPELATFVAELLKADKDGLVRFEYIEKYARFGDPVECSYAFTVNELSCFHSELHSPIIRHLIEEEMEKRGYDCEVAIYTGSLPEKKYDAFFCKTIGPKNYQSALVDNENKTRAVALAAYRTGER